MSFPFSLLPPPESAQAIGWLSLALFCLTGGINQVLRLTDRLRPKEPVPPLSRQFADKDETDHRFDRIELKIDDQNRLNEERAAKMHDRINQVLEGVSHIRGRCTAFHQGDRS